LECGNGIVDDQERKRRLTFNCFRPVLADQGRSRALRRRFCDKIVTVKSLSTDRDEKIAGLQRSRISFEPMLHGLIVQISANGEHRCGSELVC
jgi:hypothetical protein